jgi:hypothetical protein
MESPPVALPILAPLCPRMARRYCHRVLSRPPRIGRGALTALPLAGARP